MSDFDSRPAADPADPQWEALLHQLRAQRPAGPRPYFYQRVLARLPAAEAPRPWLPGWVRRPAYAALLGALVLLLSGDDAGLPAPAPPAPAGAGQAR